MNKSKKTSLRILAILGTVVGGLLLLYVAISLWFFEIPNVRAKKYIQTNYGHVTLPAYLKLLNQQWEAGDIDNAALWHYTYGFTQPEATVLGDVTSSMQAAGYTIVPSTSLTDAIKAQAQPETQASDQIEARDQAVNMYLQANFGKQTLSIDAQEIN